MLKIAKEKMPELLNAWAKIGKLYVPQDQDGVSNFLPWDGKGKLTLGQGNSVLPPKDLFFPRTETMYRYQRSGGALSLEEVVENEKQILVGIRSCDARSIALLDDVFLTKGYVDEFYRRRRENTLIVALACNVAQDTCFCTSFGIDPGRAEGVDIQVWEVDGSYILEAGTEKGRELLGQAPALLMEAGEGGLPEAPACNLKVDLAGVTEKLQQMFEHPFWAQICRKCLGCGLCTYLCPTCHCFDIQSENRGDSGIKFRCWDSCMFSEYTRMAGGHNPRPSKKERVRNRFLHKLQYFPERYGKFGCVGCGRCLSYCPVNMDITRIIGGIKEVDLNG
ncbi:MAG: hypothetical protein PWP65_352 [Clostridia bacterium]|nr:hypothetical protein [Clostridia bacterium]